MARIDGTTDDDRLFGTMDNDDIDGSEGFDTLIYDIPFAGIGVLHREGVLYLDARDAGGGIDRIDNVEEVLFSDGTRLSVERSGTNTKVTVRDEGGVNEWRAITTKFDGDGQIVDRDVVFDDGTRNDVFVEFDEDIAIRRALRDDPVFGRALDELMPLVATDPLQIETRPAILDAPNDAENFRTLLSDLSMPRAMQENALPTLCAFDEPAAVASLDRPMEEASVEIVNGVMVDDGTGSLY